MQDGSILLVEDNADDEALTIRALQKSKLKNPIIIARDGAEALEILFGEKKERPKLQLILLDLKLPKVDGLEVLAQVRRKHDIRHLPVVILTSSREEQDLVRGYQLGVNAFVVKPVGFQEFFRAIQDLGVFWAVLNEPPPRAAASGE